MCSHNISVWHAGDPDAFINTAVNSRTHVMFGAERGRVENAVWTFLSSGLLLYTLHWESTQKNLHFSLKLRWTRICHANKRNTAEETFLTLFQLFLCFQLEVFWRNEKTSSLFLIGCESVTSVCSSRKFQKEPMKSHGPLSHVCFQKNNSHLMVCLASGFTGLSSHGQVPWLMRYSLTICFTNA